MNKPILKEKSEPMKMIREIVLRLVDREEYAVFLFGSRAGKHFRPDSDVDVGIWGEKPLENDWKAIILGACDAAPVPWKVELVDFSRVSEEFKNFALEEIQLWNLPKNSNVLEHFSNKPWGVSND